MSRQLLLLSLVAVSGCAPRHDEIVGPFSGVTYRFVVDRMMLPMRRSDFADDLNGDGRVDNQLANIAGALAGQNDLTTGLDDMLRSGALSPIVEITTDDPALRNDPTVGVRFVGRDGDSADVLGGALSDGVLISNHTRTTRHPASATMYVPLYKYADPLALPAIGLEVQLLPDGDGFVCLLRGAFPSPSYVQPAWAGMVQMIAANPPEFLSLMSIVDLDNDGVLSLADFTTSGLIRNLTAPDVELTDGHGNWAPNPDPIVTIDHSDKDSLSFALSLHLTRCPVGNCQATPPINTCQDRFRDGDESDVDCGGSCIACPGSAHCNGNADCQSQQCVGGVCTAPNCNDGLQDGFESAVDCGHTCSPCAVGLSCRGPFDCASRFCDSSASNGGVCEPSMCNDGILDAGEGDIDCGTPCTPCSSGRHCNVNSDCASGICGTVCSGTTPCITTCW